MIARMRRWLTRFGVDERASTVVEMALAIPVLLILALGGVEVARYVLLNQKVTRATTSMADLVSQAESVTASDLDGLYQASVYILEPFKLPSDGVVLISSIVASGGKSTIAWQKALGGIAGGSKFGLAGGAATLPTGFTIRDGDSVIAAETFYKYSPLFAGQYLAADTLYSSALYKPRFTSQVKYSN